MRTTPLEWHDASNTSEDHPFRETLCLVEIATPPGAKTREFATAYRMNGIWIRNENLVNRTNAASWASLANVEDLDFRDASVKPPEDGSYVLVRHAIPTAVKKAMKLSPAPLYPIALATARYSVGRWQTADGRTLRANHAEKIEWVPLDAFSHPAGSTSFARDATTSTKDDGIAKIQFMEVPHNAEIAALMAIIEKSRKEIHAILGVPTTDDETMKAMRSETGLNRARAAFSSACGRMEQAHAQARGVPPIETRRMEFECVADILGKLMSESKA